MLNIPASTGRPSNGQVIFPPGGWKFTDADSRYGDDYRIDGAPKKAEDAPLGILKVLEGKTFKGTGLNMLFRPNSSPPPDTTIPNPVTPDPPQFPNNNIVRC